MYVGGESVRIPEMRWRDDAEAWEVLEEPKPEEVVVWPNDLTGKEKVWVCSPDRARDEIADIKVERNADRIEIYKKYRPNQEGALPGTWWEEAGYSASESGTRILKDLFGGKPFDYPKSINLVVDCLRVCRADDSRPVLDYFAGSGTTGHAVISLNREDGRRRRFLLVEAQHYFGEVLLPRMKKIIFTPDWVDAKPARYPNEDEVKRSPRLLRIVRLESYEDALNNLQLKRSDAQQSLLDQHAELREDYMLRYMLDVESRGSGSLLNIERFDDPFNYRLNISTGTAGETEPRTVDLVETFNYLLGLRVKTMDEVRGVRVVTGLNPAGERVLILWRKLRETDNDALDAWFRKQGYNTKDQEFDVIYVNGDNNLENLRQGEQTWKVRLIEQEFQRLMFDEEGI